MTLLVGRQEGHLAPKKLSGGFAGVVICPERGADLHMARLMPLSLTVSCFSKIQIGFTFLVPAHAGSPGQRAVKRMCVILGNNWPSFLGRQDDRCADERRLQLATADLRPVDPARTWREREQRGDKVRSAGCVAGQRACSMSRLLPLLLLLLLLVGGGGGGTGTDAGDGRAAAGR